MEEGRDLRDIMRGGGNRQEQDREVVDRSGDRLVERRRQYSGDSLELDDGSDLRDSNTNMVIQVGQQGYFRSYELFLEDNFQVQQQKRTLIERRMKRVNLTKSRFHSLLPSHLKIDSETLVGQFLSQVKRKDVLVRINELKVVEYYSR